MNEQLTKYNSELTSEEIKVLEDTSIIPKGTPTSQIKLFSKVCAEKNLSPFSKQIYLIARKDNKTNTIRYSHQTGIDGLRSIAERTGQYAGSDDYLFDEGVSEFAMKSNKRNPTTATATIYKIVANQKGSFTASASWDEYYPGDHLGFMWKKMPFTMLGKCAEAKALRKAFPELLGNIYVNEEMQQAGELLQNNQVITDALEDAVVVETTATKVTAMVKKRLIEIANESNNLDRKTLLDLTKLDTLDPDHLVLVDKIKEKNEKRKEDLLTQFLQMKNNLIKKIENGDEEYLHKVCKIFNIEPFEKTELIKQKILELPEKEFESVKSMLLIS